MKNSKGYPKTSGGIPHRSRSVALSSFDAKRSACSAVEARARALASGDGAGGDLPMCGAHLLGSGWSGPRGAPPPVREAALAASAAATAAALEGAAGALTEDEEVCLKRLTGGPAPLACVLCDAPCEAPDLASFVGVATCAAGHLVDACARTRGLIPLDEDRWTCPGCGLSCRDSPDKLPHLPTPHVCLLCDLPMSKS